MADVFTVNGEFGDVLDRFEVEGWTDGLPVVPPTENAVTRMLASTDLEPDEVVARLPPAWGEATVRAVAVNAVMAGCRPVHLPVVLAAIDAIADPAFNLVGIQTTTSPTAVMTVVNGPIAREVGFSGAGNCLGPGTRANATVGRAVALVMLNIGGATPGSVDASTQGQPAKYGVSVTENEEASPWEPYHVERGFDAAASTVSVFSITCLQTIMDHTSRRAVDLLRTLASSCATIGHQNVQLGGGPLLLLSPEHAAILAGDGFSKADVRGFLYENARVPVGDFPPEMLQSQIHRRRPRRYHSTDPRSTVPLADSPDAIQVLVVGGPGPHSMVAPSFGRTTSVPIKVLTRRDGTPLQSVRDLVPQQAASSADAEMARPGDENSLTAETT